jgi:hypothetical protein
MTKNVTLREMVEAMSAYADDETFRWHACPDYDMRVTYGQVRQELGISKTRHLTVVPEPTGDTT